jgi:NitT/TauT family transport system ATP-binding protein
MEKSSLNHPPTVLEATALSFAYPGGANVFGGFSLATESGEFVALVGPSGCGKTTLLNLLAGFLAPNTGTVLIGGARATPENPALGYVFQTPNLFPWLSVLENIRFGLRMAGGDSPAQQREKARRYLALVGLAETADLMPHHLSGGMKQRVALARTLALEPGLLLMDEPFAALDAFSRLQMNDELLRIWSATGPTIVFITHDIDEAIFLADRAIILGLPPDGIAGELSIELPRPRDRVLTRADRRFSEYRSELTRRIAEIADNAGQHKNNINQSGAEARALI